MWLRDPTRALAWLRPGVDREGANPEALSLAAWLALTSERDAEAAEHYARAALADQTADTRFATAALAEVLQRRGDNRGAVGVLRQARDTMPEIKWYALSLADALESAGEIDEAERLLEEATADAELRRHAIKRLSRLALKRGDHNRALHWYSELVGLAPDYLVYSSDYATLGRLQFEAGDRDGARATWERGAKTFPRNGQLRKLRAEHFGEQEPPAMPRIKPVSENEIGARRIPVRTPMINARTGLLPLLDEASRALRRPGDVVTLAESAAAAGQGRLIPLELITPGPMARRFSRYVGKIGPLHSPEGMQGAILEAGRPRVLLGAIASVVGKALGRSGWFYRVAGPGTAMIDDVAAALPPHDHHVIFGPAKPDRLADELSEALDSSVAIVDANHLTGAWVVGASAGVDRKWVEAALADNPAGNEDEQTPVVLIRPLARDGAGTERQQ
jgi:tetratricopeptide (TPR) repeat protein